MSVLPSVDRPSHVTPQLVVDFDFMRPGPEGSDPLEAWKRLHGLPPLVWTPRNGGHWLVTRGEDIPAILKNYQLFSSRRAFIVWSIDHSIAKIARVVREDIEYLGASLQAGEQILMATCVHGLDERSFECPMEVRFDRKDSSKHSTLSHGIHRCIGAPLATQEIRIFLEEWLARIPDNTTVADDPPAMATGIVHGLTRLALQWDL